MWLADTHPEFTTADNGFGFQLGRLDEARTCRHGRGAPGMNAILRTAILKSFIFLTRFSSMVVCKRFSVNILESSRIWRPHIAPAIVSDWAPESWRTWEVN